MYQNIQYSPIIPYWPEAKFDAWVFNRWIEVTKDRDKILYKVKSQNEDFCIKLGLPKCKSSVEGWRRKKKIIPKGDSMETCFYSYCLLDENKIIRTEIVSIT